MFRLLAMILLISVVGCSGSAEGALEGAIESANDNDLEGFLDLLDEQTREFFRIGLADEERLSGDWVVLQWKFKENNGSLC